MTALENVQTFGHPQLLANLKKSVEFSTQTNRKYEDTSLEQIKRALTDILLDGFIFPTKSAYVDNVSNRFGQSENHLDKLFEDFEWLCRTAQIRNPFNDADGRLPTQTATRSSTNEPTIITSLPTPPTLSLSSTSTSSYDKHNTSVECFLYEWITRNLRAHCLCACLQTLGTDAELLHCYYTELAFMRNENLTTALFICITAYELNQSNLLSQIGNELYRSSSTISATPTKHKRTGSHPFSILLSTAGSATTDDQVDGSQVPQRTRPQSGTSVFRTLRRVKSLPIIEFMRNEAGDDAPTVHLCRIRPRSKTVNARWTASQPKDIPNSATNSIGRSSPACRLASIMTPPSSGAADSLSSAAGTLSSSLSSASQHSDSRSPRIELIKCDDIKIWTDQSYEQHKEKIATAAATTTCDIPQNNRTLKPKSLSPMNGLLCSLFGTPPTYTSWSLSENAYDADPHGATDTTAVDVAAASAYPCNTPKEHLNNSSAGVFDAFLPVDGQKLRNRKSSNLFDGDISATSTATAALDYTASTSGSHEASGECESPQLANNKNKNQSLTAFLQMSHLNRNDTELEKENAHFLISEAIISAIEHMKWAKKEPLEAARRLRGKPTEATDWLENDTQTHSNAHKQLSGDGVEPTEHISYAEVGENGLDLLSAEVVGLTLISKFDDKQLPKVSELKWLVTEDQAPQQLLPMPYALPSQNPDDNVMPSLTRGTKYWAPPRQQIIFTDHPQVDRQLLIQKQNSRCAGCGMRVAKQYLRSFRYCSYLGKYFCTGCHRNQISAIPAKILHSWDFKCYPVSVFAYRLLEMMYTFPLFYVPDLNAALYADNKILVTARNKRRQLSFVKDFIRTCRFASREQKYFEMVPSYITDDADLWSLADFIDTRNKSMHRSIDELIERCSNHIYNCVLCSARGFICEHCHSPKVIYPWESKRFRCDRCGSCFHLNCWKSMQETCCRCQRINKRLDNITIADI